MELYTFLESRGFKVAKVFSKGLEILSYNPDMEILDMQIMARTR